MNNPPILQHVYDLGVRVLEMKNFNSVDQN